MAWLATTWFFCCFNITINVDSPYKQAIMAYGAYMHRVGLSLNKVNVLKEFVLDFHTLKSFKENGNKP